MGGKVERNINPRYMGVKNLRIESKSVSVCLGCHNKIDCVA